MASDFSYKLTLSAQKELDEILFYMTDTLSNPTAAASFLDKFEDAVKTLTVFPESGALCKNPFSVYTDIRKIPVKNYTAFYKVDREKRLIIIIKVVYSHRNMEEIHKELHI